ncbi:MAG: glutamine synthetase family protein [Pseudomonadota bacterium]
MTHAIPACQATELADFIAKHKIRTISLASPDLHGYARGKQLTADALLKSPDSPIHLSTLLALLDYGNYPIEPPPDDTRWWPGWHNGYADCVGKIDTNSVRQVPWQHRTALALCDFEPVDQSYSFDFFPRRMLSKLVEQVEAKGYTVRIGYEMEMNLFRRPINQQSNSGATYAPLWPRLEAYLLTTLGRHYEFIHALIEGLRDFKLNIESWHSEAAPGQLEITLGPNLPSKAADDAFLLKYAVKELAAANDLVASFMARISNDAFSNGNHINLSVWRDDKNLFFDNGKVSNTLRQATAGIIDSLPELVLMYAPTPNSFRRYEPYLWTGSQLAWGIDNKSTVLRAVVDRSQSARLEQRAGGADANPYLLAAAMLVGFLHGVDKGLVPPEPVSGDAYADTKIQSLGGSFEAAIDRFSRSDIAAEYLDADFIRFYTHTRRAENILFQQHVGEIQSKNVSDWEFSRYFESV